MNSRLELIIYYVSGKRTNIEEIESMNFRLTDGSLIGIHPGHDRLIGMTDGSEFRYTKDGKEFRIEVSSGMVTIENNVVKVFTTL